MTQPAEIRQSRDASKAPAAVGGQFRSATANQSREVSDRLSGSTFAGIDPHFTEQLQMDYKLSRPKVGPPVPLPRPQRHGKQTTSTVQRSSLRQETPVAPHTAPPVPTGQAEPLRSVPLAKIAEAKTESLDVGKKQVIASVGRLALKSLVGAVLLNPVTAIVTVPLFLLGYSAGAGIGSLILGGDKKGTMFKEAYTKGLPSLGSEELASIQKDIQTTGKFFGLIKTATTTEASSRAQVSSKKADDYVLTIEADPITQKIEKGQLHAVTASGVIQKYAQKENRKDLDVIAAEHKAEIEADFLAQMPEIPIDTKANVVSGPAHYQPSNNYALTPIPGTVKPVPENNDVHTAITEYAYFDPKTNKPVAVMNVVPPTSVFQGKIYSAPDTAINCDYGIFQQEHDGSYTSSFCDGCGWGGHVQLAAKNAAHAAQNYTEAKMRSGSVKTLRDVARTHMEAFTAAQAEVLKGDPALPKEKQKDGTTTMVQGTIVQKQGSPEKIGVFTTLGDVKIYITKKDGTVVEATPEERGGRRNATDPGGRLGKDVVKNRGGDPDYRNFRVSAIKLEDGDTVHYVSDGTHDCLNPEELGLSPEEVVDYLVKQDPKSAAELKSVKNQKSWEKLDPKKHEALATKYMCAKFAELTKGKSPKEAALALEQYREEITFASKVYMHTNKSRLPDDHKKYPGKMDHATTLSFMVGK